MYKMFKNINGFDFKIQEVKIIGTESLRYES